MLIDTHAHLTDARYKEFLDKLITDLPTENVGKVFTVAYSRQSIIDSVELARKYPNIYAIIGIHPDEVADYTDDTIKLIKEYAQDPKVIAIGEIGLDYHYENYDKAEQKRVFVSQLELAHELGLPISIHNRDSIGDMLEILKEHKHLLNNSGVFHCFSESPEVFKEIKKLGLKIAFGGTLTFKNSVTAPKTCEIAELEDIILETDCPYLAPHPLRGTLNKPQNTRLVAEKIALIKGVSYDKVVETTTENALKLFPKAR